MMLLWRISSLLEIVLEMCGDLANMLLWVWCDDHRKTIISFMMTEEAGAVSSLSVSNDLATVTDTQHICLADGVETLISALVMKGGFILRL